MSQLKITQTKSVIGSIPKHRKTIEALGLGRPNKVTVQQDNAAIRGMIHQIKHMVKVEEI